MMNLKKNDLFQFGTLAVMIIVIGYVLQFAFFKWDLTEEKRHTLTDATKEMLENLEDKVFVRCYLHGEFPANFKRLENSVREKLEEFEDYSDGKVQFEFIDPYANPDKKRVADQEKALDEKGIKFTRLSLKEKGTQQFKLIWPGCIIEYRGKETPVQFFKSESPTFTDEMINASVNNLEYELASRLRLAIRQEKPAVAVLEGHKELQPIQMADFLGGVEENYSLDFVKINEQINALSDQLDGFQGRKNKYGALVIAKPDSAISEKDRVIIDQYIMNGGKVLWMIDPVITDLDSLRTRQETMAMSNENGLYEQLFEYGVRLNRNIVIDFQCAPIAFDAGPKGNQRDMQMFNWYYAPLMFTQDMSHPIVSHLDPIKLEFASSLDTVNAGKGIKKTPLLKSSVLSRAWNTPVRINTSIVGLDQNYFESNKGNGMLMAVLMEGEFPSAFYDQLPSAIRTDKKIGFKNKSNPTAMIVIADGDIVKNGLIPNQTGYTPLPLGYDRYARGVIYDNKEFLMNCINYLLDDKSLISVRSRTIKLRKLDTKKIAHQKIAIQLANTALPLSLVFALGIGQYLIRRKKWSKKG
jgi:ABC-2 type transport system permease protein